MSQELRIYKPNKSNNGAASKFQVVVKGKKNKEGKSFDQLMSFITMSAQTGVDADGNASFAWGDPTKEVILKISPLDAATMIAALVGMEPEAKLFHQNQNGSTTLTISRSEKGVLYLRTTAKKGSDAPVQLNHSLTSAEAILLKIYLEQFVGAFYAS